MFCKRNHKIDTVKENSDNGNEHKKIVDKVVNAESVGATPFEQYKGHPEVQKNVQSSELVIDEIKKE